MMLTRRPRSAFVLIVVLVTVVIVTLAAFTFTRLMVQEQQVTRLTGRQIQTNYLVESGVDFTRLILSYDVDTRRALGGIWSNPELFQNKVVSIDLERPEQIGRFSIIAAGLDSEGYVSRFRHGLTDESSRLNLNTLLNADAWLPDTGNGSGGVQLLNALPQMTPQVADAILDWMDTDDEPRESGAESSYYAGLNPPYAPKNGPMDSIEELLLIRGVTPQLLFGLDANHNGVLDQQEQFDSDVSGVEADMVLGWANYLTLYSKESNRNAQGLQRVYLNGDDLEVLEDELDGAGLPDEWAKFIIAYRQYGAFSGDIPEDQEPSRLVQLDLTQPAQFAFNQILDIVDAQTELPYTNGDGDEVSVVLESPITESNLAENLPILMDNLSTIDSDVIPGRINIMQAPRTILAGIPGMTEEVLNEIIRQREFELDDPSLSDLNRRFETWIMLPPIPIVDLQTMKLMMPFICAGGSVYRAEIVGYFDDGVATSRAEVILDTTIPIPRVLFWRDKSHLPSGYTVDTLGTDLSE